MEKIIVNVSIEQVADNEGVSEIKVLASQNGLPVFSEEFKSKDKPFGVHLYSSKDVESYDTAHSASLASISALASTISRSVKTSGKVIEDESYDLWRVNHIIREFERLVNVRFDYNRFKTIREFQQYFKGLMKDANKAERLYQMKQVKQLLTRLHDISVEIGKPLDSPDVPIKYQKRFGGFEDIIGQAVIHPIYFPPENCHYYETDVI